MYTTLDIKLAVRTDALPCQCHVHSKPNLTIPSLNCLNTHIIAHHDLPAEVEKNGSGNPPAQVNLWTILVPANSTKLEIRADCELCSFPKVVT